MTPSANAAPRKQQRTSIKRILIALAIIFVAPVIGVILYAASYGIPASLLWHLRHGNTVAMEGHIFRVPLTLHPEQGEIPNEIMMLGMHPVRGGLEMITVEPSRKQSSEAEILAGLEKIVTFFAHSKHPTLMTIEHLQGQRLSFDCLRDEPIDGVEDLTCYAAGANIKITTSAPLRYRNEMRDFITSSN